jgi:hypothetical protein
MSTFDFKYDDGGMGKGGTIELLANGKKIGEGRVEKTTPYKYSLYEGQDIAQDSGSQSISRTRRHSNSPANSIR